MMVRLQLVPKIAWKEGYSDGHTRRTYFPHRNYQTSECYLAWYDGWKAGQAHKRQITDREAA